MESTMTKNSTARRAFLGGVARRVTLATALGTTLIAVGGTAAAAAAVNPVENGVVSSCFRTRNGRGLRLVDPATACKSKETALKLGQQGPKGDAGTPGTPGLSEYEVIPVAQPIPGAGGYTFDAACPDGKNAISGGYAVPSGSTIQESHPRDGDPTVWRLAFTVPGPTTITLYLQCARTQ